MSWYPLVLRYEAYARVIQLGTWIRLCSVRHARLLYRLTMGHSFTHNV